MLPPAVSVDCVRLFRVSHCIHIYIYMLCRLCTRVYIAIYVYMQGIYAYMEPGKHIYRSYIYIYIICLFLCVCVFCMLHMCKWVQIGANECFVAYQKLSCNSCSHVSTLLVTCTTHLHTTEKITKNLTTSKQPEILIAELLQLKCHCYLQVQI